MLSYALEKGLDVLKKNKAIFIPFIILGIISILSFLLVAKPMFELSYQSSYSSSAFYTSTGSDSYFFKKIMDNMSLIIIWSVFMFFVTVLANVVGMRAVKDYLNGQKTKISDMEKTALTKGFVTIFASLASMILFFLPGIIGILVVLFASSTSNLYSNTGGGIELMLIALIMFLIQAIILLAFGYHILSGKFRKIYMWGIIVTVILLVLSVVAGVVFPVLSLIFIVPLLILYIVLCIALCFITIIGSLSITYIIPSVIVLEDDNISATEAIKKSLNFAKNYTKNFSLLILIYIVIIMLISVPSFIISFAYTLHPSFSLYLFSQIFTIALSAIISPYILSIFALAYAFSLRKEKEVEKKRKEILLTEEIKSGQNFGFFFFKQKTAYEIVM